MQKIKYLLVGLCLALSFGVLASSVTGPIFNPASVAIRGGAINATTIGATTPAAGTFSTLTSAGAAITGGAINGTTVGETTPAAGTFSALTSSGVAITGGTINATTVGATTPASGAFSTLNATSSIAINGQPTVRTGTISIASGFGTSPAISQQVGTAAFRVSVGTGGTATTGIVTMPAAGVAWLCTGHNVLGAVTGDLIIVGAATTLTISNTVRGSGAAVAWASGTVIQFLCVPY